MFSCTFTLSEFFFRPGVYVCVAGKLFSSLRLFKNRINESQLYSQRQTRV